MSKLRLSKTKASLFLLFIALAVVLTLTMFFHAGQFGILNSDIFHIRGTKIILLFVGSFSVGFATFIMQKMMRNNIVDSSFFGIASFNLFILVIIIVFFETGTSISKIYKLYMPFISLGASVFIAMVMMLTILKKSAQKTQSIVLVGIIFNYLFLALAYVFMEKIEPGNIASILDIGLGVVNEHMPFYIFMILFSIQAVSVAWYQLIYKKIRITNINSKLAENMGHSPKWVKIQQILIIGINVSISFSIIGGVSFLGIISANLAVFIMRNNRWSVILSGIIAAFVTALAYLLFNCFGDLYYPIGIASSLITVPYFIFKIIRSKYA